MKETLCVLRSVRGPLLAAHADSSKARQLTGSCHRELRQPGAKGNATEEAPWSQPGEWYGHNSCSEVKHTQAQTTVVRTARSREYVRSRPLKACGATPSERPPEHGTAGGWLLYDREKRWRWEGVQYAM